jgi:hypothetical protein
MTKKPSGQYLGLIVISNLPALVWIWIWETSVVLPHYLVRMENRLCLSRGVYVIGATWRVATRIVAGVGDLVQRTRDGQAQVGYSVAGRLRGQLMVCMICTVPSHYVIANIVPSHYVIANTTWQQHHATTNIASAALSPARVSSAIISMTRQRHSAMANVASAALSVAWLRG